MIINSPNLRILTTGYRANFAAGLAAVAPMWTRFATEVPSTTSEEIYPWMKQIPAMREWVGERHLHNVQADAYRIVNRDWEQTVEVDRNAIEDDRFGIFAPLMGMMGDAAARQPDELVFSTIPKGFSTNCFDGQFYFDADHPVIGADGVPRSVSNMQAGAGSPWFLFDLSKALKPIIFQNRRKASFVARDNPDDPKVFDRKVFTYGSDARNATGFGFWQTAFGSKADLDVANFDAAYTAMTLFTKDHGEPLAITPNVLLVGPSNRAKAEQILKKANLAGGESNINYGRVELVVAPWLG